MCEGAGAVAAVGRGTSGSSGACRAARASSGGGRPNSTSRERLASVGVPPAGVGVGTCGATGGDTLGAGGWLRKPLPVGGRGGNCGAGRAGGEGLPTPGGRAKDGPGGMPPGATGTAERGGGRPPQEGRPEGLGAWASGGSRVLAAKGQVPLPDAGPDGGGTLAGGSGARGAPDKMRSSGVGARGPGAGAWGAAGRVPGRVKWRAAPGWLGATCEAGAGARGRVKPPVAEGAAGVGGAASGGPSWKLPWARPGERRSNCKSRDSNAGGCAGVAASSAQEGHSPNGGSSAPHFRHFDTARHERRNGRPTQESGACFSLQSDRRMPPKASDSVARGGPLKRAHSLLRRFLAPQGAYSAISGPNAASTSVAAALVAQLVATTKASPFAGASQAVAYQSVLLQVCVSAVPPAQLRETTSQPSA
jgi:hypothetical protein